MCHYDEYLNQDLLQHPETWETKTLPDILEALASYTEDIQGYYDNTNANMDAEKAARSTFADIFKGAKIKGNSKHSFHLSAYLLAKNICLKIPTKTTE